MINAHHIVYDNLSSEEFDLVACLAFDSDNGASDSFLNREAISTEVYDGSRKFIHGSKYTDSATPRFTLMKKNFGDFSSEENRKVLAWLTGNNKPSWLEIYKDDSNVLDYRYFCIISSVEQYKLANGRVVGYEFEITSSAPYAYSRKFIYPEVWATNAEISNNDETNDYLQVYGITDPITITCNTDEYNKLVYPKVIIKFNGTDIYFPVSSKPSDDDKMISNVIYTYTDGSSQKYYVNISMGDTSLRTEVVRISKDTEPSLDLIGVTGIYYFYDKDNQIIKKLSQDGTKFETIVKVGAAVKINTSYIFDGELISKEIIVKGAALGEEITLDGVNKVISVTPNDGVRIIGNDFNWEWLPLAYGDNNITIAGNCAVQIQWIEPLKVGSL